MKETDRLRRRILQLGLPGLAVLLGMPVAPATALPWPSRKTGPDRSIHRLRGQLRIDGVPASRETPVKPSSTLETGPRSQAVFRIGPDAHLLRENSRIELASSDGILVDGLRLLSGALLSVIGERKPGERYVLSTATASIGIRGTGIYVESDARGTYACTCYGEVELAVRDNPGQREVIRADHHESPRYVLPGPGGSMQITEAPMKNHSDAELMLIESLVGRKPPFGTGGYDDSGY